MTTSTKRIKVYSDSRARIGPDVQAALGLPSHLSNASAVVVATSKKEAVDIAATHGVYSDPVDMMLRGRVDPEHGDVLDNHGEALRDAGLLRADAVGACYVHGHTGPVVDATSADRDVVGYLSPRRQGFGFDFRHATATDELRDACERVRAMALAVDVREFGRPHPDAVALRLVLAAAESTLPRL